MLFVSILCVCGYMQISWTFLLGARSWERERGLRHMSQGGMLFYGSHVNLFYTREICTYIWSVSCRLVLNIFVLFVLA